MLPVNQGRCGGC